MTRYTDNRAEPLGEFVFGQREKARSEFDSLHGSSINTLVADIGRTYAVLVLSVTEGAELFPGCRFDGFSLLNSALQSLVSSLQLIRQRARVDAFALLRVAVESACVAVHVVLDAHAYSEYVGGSDQKYDATRAISFANAHIYRVGKFWGALSQTAIHPNARAFGPHPTSDRGLGITVGAPAPSLEQERVSLLVISIAALIVFRAAELVLFARDPDRPEILRLCGTNWTVSEIGNSVLEKRFQELSATVPE